MLRVWVAVWPCPDVAVTVIAQRPAVSSSGGIENEPSSATLIVVPLAGPALAPGDAGGGVGLAVAGGAPGAEPRKAVVTITVAALVVVPSTAIAPFPYVVPSTGCVTVSVGAWKPRNGTALTT